MTDFAIWGPIERDDLPGLCERVCAALRAAGTTEARCDVTGVGSDAVVVDALARLHVAARRLGCRVTLEHASPELRGLVGLMGLEAVLAEENGRVPAMHDDELPIDETLVRSLLEEQFPHWAGLPLRRVEPSGTVNAIFRLGDGLSVRLPRREGSAAPDERDEWLPRLAPLLPLELPLPVAQGRPGRGYPWTWAIHTWVDGETVRVASVDERCAARDLAAFVAALQRVSAEGAPPGRGIPLADRAAQLEPFFERYGDRRAAAAWERALAAPPWTGAPVWHHGDLDARNWVVRDGRIRGVIDWGTAGAGDPACDVMVAWKLGSQVGRDAFRSALPVDDATWERARGWVVSQAVAILAYYTPETNDVLVREAESWLALALADG